MDNLNLFYRHLTTAIKLILFVSFSFFEARAAIETVTYRAPLTNLVPGNNFSLQDNKYLSPLAYTYAGASSIATITYGFDESLLHVLPPQFSSTLAIQYKTFDAAGTATSLQTASLTINYNQTRGTQYTNKQHINVANAYKVEVIITSITTTDGAATPITISNPAGLYLDLLIETDRGYKTSDATFAVSELDTPADPNAGTNEITISWKEPIGADYYEFEWIYLDDYTPDASLVSAGGAPGTQSTSQILFDFSSQATRIQTPNNYWALPLYYESGYVIYRVRAIGHDNNGRRIESVWDAAGAPNKHKGSLQGFIAEYPHNVFHIMTDFFQSNLTNVNYAASFSEGGKKVTGISYSDGLLKTRQTQGTNPADAVSVIANTLYDFHGRPAIQTLPAPKDEQTIYFKPNAVMHTATGIYDKYYFEGAAFSSATCSPAIIDPVDVTHSAGLGYYSPQNTAAATAFNSYIPDAMGYPFAHTIYGTDGRNQVSRQSGVGPVHQNGTGKELAFSTVSAEDEILQSLFGTDKGPAQSYSKEITRDPNGQYSVSYKDIYGRVVATALAGPTPAATEKLDDFVTLDGNGNVPKIDQTLLEGTAAATGGTDGSINKLDLDNYSAANSYEIYTYADETDVLINYSFDPALFSDNCNTHFCATCLYDFSIQIIDECGNELTAATVTVPVGSPAYQNNTNANECTLSPAAVNYFTNSGTGLPDYQAVTFPVKGKYKIIKTLKVSDTPLDTYFNQWAGSNNTCVKPESDFFAEMLDINELAGCDGITCEECQAMAQGLSGAEQEAWLTICNNYCSVLNPQTIPVHDPCYDLRKKMLADFYPGGQYAQFNINETTGAFEPSADPLSVFSESGAAYVYSQATNTYTYTPAGSTEQIIFNGTAFSPAIPNGLENFIKLYMQHLEFAEVFLPYHPEYSQLAYCETNNGTAYNLYQYEKLLKRTNTFGEAYARGLLTPINPSDPPSNTNSPVVLNPYNNANMLGTSTIAGYTTAPVYDPFFKEPVSAPAYAVTRQRENLITNVINAYSLGSSSTLTLYEAAVKMVNPTLTTLHTFGSDDCTKDEEWRVFRNLYLAYRSVFVDYERVNHTIANNSYTGCIGKNDANTSGPTNSTFVSADLMMDPSIGLVNLTLLNSAYDNVSGYFNQFTFDCYGVKGPPANTSYGCSVSAAPGMTGNHLFIDPAQKVCNASVYQLYKDKQAVFPLPDKNAYRNLDVSSISNPSAYINNQLNSTAAVTQCQETCQGNADMWLSGLSGCGLSQAESESLKVYLVNICQASCDALHMEGASNSTSVSPQTFEAALLAVVGSSRITDLCNTWLLPVPSAYDHVQHGGEVLTQAGNATNPNTLTTAYLDNTGCDKILANEALYTALSAANTLPEGVGSGDQLFFYTYGINISDIYATANCACNTAKADWSTDPIWTSTQIQNIRNAKIPATDGFYTPVCVTCTTVTAAYNDFVTDHSGWTASPEFELMAQNYLNTTLNLNFTWNDYLSFMNDCAAPGGIPANTYTTGTVAATIDYANTAKGNALMDFFQDLIVKNPFSARGTKIYFSPLTLPSYFKGASYRDLRFYDGRLFELEMLEPLDAADPIQFIITEHYADADYTLNYYLNKPVEGTTTLATTFSQLKLIAGTATPATGTAYTSLPLQITCSYSGTLATKTFTLEGSVFLLIARAEAAASEPAAASVIYDPFPSSLALCNRSVLSLPGFSEPDPCFQEYIDRVKLQAHTAWINHLQEKKQWFINRYKTNCLMYATEHYKLKQENYQYHYTLYYYDNADNVYKTVPPAGVTTNGSGVHTLATLYEYDSGNRLIKSTEPDHLNAAGNAVVPTDYYYSSEGLLLASQNGKQKAAGTTASFVYSFTTYDALGRIRKAGEVTLSEALPVSGSLSYRNYLAFLLEKRNGDLREVTTTLYNDYINRADVTLQANGGLSDDGLLNLRNRVASVTIEETDTPVSYTVWSDPENGRPDFTDIDDATDVTYDFATHYNYNEHGQVKQVLQDNYKYYQGINQQYKRTDYSFELISGNIKQIDYQLAGVDRFSHKYLYDAANRLKRAFTSTNGVQWDNDVTYQYYKHGPLARIETGEEKVQGTDYAYNLQGWLKGINSTALSPEYDMGKDGQAGNSYGLAANEHRLYAQDAVAFNLNYYSNGRNAKALGIANATSDINDYIAIKNINNSKLFYAAYSENTDMNGTGATLGKSLFNGNIASMITTIRNANPADAVKDYTALPQLTANSYDQLNRVDKMKAYRDYNQSTNSFGNGQTADNGNYYTEINYDASGNISTMLRNGFENTGASLAMDNLSYHYKANTNQLDYVEETATGVSGYTTDIKSGQSGNNYAYNELGQLKYDRSEEQAVIEWTIYGKVKKVTRTAQTPVKPDVEYLYDALGNRVVKIINPQPTGGVRPPKQYTFYAYDASGNVMAEYTRSGGSDLVLAQQLIYGAARAGTKNYDYFNVQTPETPAVAYANTLGTKSYELGNHLGNVLTVVSDRKIATYKEDVYSEDFTGLTSVPTGYTTTAACTTGTGIPSACLSIDADALKIVTNTVNDGVFKTFTTVAGTTYRITFNADVSGVSTGESVSATVKDGATVLDMDIAQTGANTLDFTATGSSVQFSLTLASNTAASDQTFYADNILLENYDAAASTATALAYYYPDILSTSDYYIGGMMMPSRGYTSSSYPYGMNTQRKSDEIFEGSYTAKYWEYDSRILRRWNSDPVGKPWQSSYSCFSGNPMWRIDPNGDDDFFNTKGQLILRTPVLTEGNSVWIINSSVAEFMNAHNVAYTKYDGDYANINAFLGAGYADAVTSLHVEDETKDMRNRKVVLGVFNFYANEIGLDPKASIGFDAFNLPVIAWSQTPTNIYIGLENGKVNRFLSNPSNIRANLRHEHYHRWGEESSTDAKIQHLNAYLAELKDRKDFDNTTSEYRKNYNANIQKIYSSRGITAERVEFVTKFAKQGIELIKGVSIKPKSIYNLKKIPVKTPKLPTPKAPTG